MNIASKARIAAAIVLAIVVWLLLMNSIGWFHLDIHPSWFGFWIGSSNHYCYWQWIGSSDYSCSF